MSRYLGSKIILEENWERYRRRWSSDENNVDDLGDDKEGGIGVVGALDGPWRRWAAAVAVEDDPFLFFDGSAIWWSFFWILIGGSEWGVKKRKIGLYGTWFGEELSENRRFEVLGMEENVEDALAAQQLWFREYL